MTDYKGETDGHLTGLGLNVRQLYEKEETCPTERRKQKGAFQEKGLLMGNKLDLVINENYSKLNSIDLHILSFIQNNLQLSTTLSIAKLAESCNVSTATVLRMTQKLNFSGYSEFKYFLKNDAVRKKEENVDIIEVLNQDISQTIKVFKQNRQIEEIYRMIDEAENIYAYGTGQGQRLMLQEVARCFLNVNKKIIMVPTSTELKIIKQYMSKKDLLFIASWSGRIEKYKETLLNLEVLGIPLVSITNLNNNELSSISKYNLYFQSTSVDKVMNINRSSYLTLHLVLHLLYDGYINYLNSI